MFKHQKITGREEGFNPAPRLRFTYTGVKERSGDKSLFPTCDFLMLGEKTDFFPPKAKLKMAKLQESPPLGGRMFQFSNSSRDFGEHSPAETRRREGVRVAYSEVSHANKHFVSSFFEVPHYVLHSLKQVART